MKFFDKLLKAPRRGQSDHTAMPLWRRYREEGEISADVAFYTPEDVEEIDDINILKKIYLCYTFTNDSPSEKERFYMQTISLCAVKKLSKMRVFPPYVVDCRNVHL